MSGQRKYSGCRQRRRQNKGFRNYTLLNAAVFAGSAFMLLYHGCLQHPPNFYTRQNHAANASHFMKLQSSFLLLSILFVTLMATRSVQAHHGQDFITVEGYEIPDTFKAVLFSDFGWERIDGSNEYGTEPSLLLGLFPRTALEVQTRFGQEPGGDWRYTSVTPSLLFQLTAPDSKNPFRVAVSLGYGFVDEPAAEEPHHDEAEEDTHEGGDHHEEASGHQHGVSGFEGRVIMEYCTGDWLLGGNFIVDTGVDDDLTYGYSAGVRYRVCEAFSTGMEAEGDFADHGSHQLIAGVYFEPMHQTVIKLGAGFGLTEESPDFTLHMGLVFRF